MLIRRLARPMLASYFIIDGLDRLGKPQEAAAEAAPAAEWLSQQTSLPNDPELLVKGLAGASVAGGILLATGRMPRPASALLAATLVPGTYIHQNFWAETDPELKAQKKANFLRNVSLAGGVVLASVDTAGRPSLRWRAEQGVQQTRKEARRAARTAKREAKLVARGGRGGDHDFSGAATAFTGAATTALAASRQSAEHAAQATRRSAEQAAEATREDRERLAKDARRRAEGAVTTVRQEGGRLGESALGSAGHAFATARHEGGHLAEVFRAEAQQAAKVTRREAKRAAKKTRREARRAADTTRREARISVKQAEKARS